MRLDKHVWETSRQEPVATRQPTVDSWHTIGLKANGTLVAVGDNYYGQCNVSAWTLN